MTDPIVLHNVHDPLCGWCYAAGPLVRAASDAGIAIVLHGGGLWDQPIHAPEAKRRMMRATDGRIAALTGQPFGSAYLDGLLVDPATVWHSRPTIEAILAAGSMDASAALPMMELIQRAHYVDGRRVVDRAVLSDLAGALRLDRAGFAAALDAVAVDRHIADTRAMMSRHGLHGYPSFLLERDGLLQPFRHEEHYGRPRAFVAAIRQQAGARDAAAATA